MKKKRNISEETIPVSGANRRGLRGILTAFALFFLIGAVYIGSLAVFYPNLPIIERKAETIPGFADYYPPFRVDESVYYIISRHVLDGILYSRTEAPEYAYTLGFPLVAAPFVAVFDKMGGYVANLLIVLASLALFFLILSRYGFRGKAIVLTLIMAFASLNWSYAISNYSEPLAQLLVLLSLLFLLPGEKTSRKGYEIVLAGVFTALNLFVRPNYILLAAPFFLYLWLGREKAKWTLNRRAWLYAAGVTGVIAFWMVRNAIFFGSPFTFEYSRLVGAYTPGMDSRYMTGNIWLGIHRLLFDEYHGLLTITPVFLLFPAGLHALWEKGMRKEALAFLAAAVMMILFVAAGPYPFTEFGLGSRHLVPLVPILLLPAAFFLDSTLFTRSVVAVVTLYSFYHAGFGWFTGGEPGMGFYLGILNDAQSRAIVLAQKGLLPQKHFDSREELIRTYRKALDDANLYRLLQTLDPMVIASIRGNERNFMLFLRSQQDPVEAILSADPSRGIIIRNFSVSQGFTDQVAPAESTETK